tara:strand:+ start:5412 stop:6716 length:1305 start_codon:yes stop_codon:yes gene_type:complete
MIKDDNINKLKKAKSLLRLNWKEGYTVPSNNLYPHQWSWDSGWIVYGYCALNQTDKAEKEMYSLFNYQWNNGLIPSIVFHDKENIDYFPGPDIWDLETNAYHLTNKFNTTGIVQPPIHALACLKIYETNKNIDFVKNIYPKLLKWHKYLYFERDIFDEGLVYIRHPWESGMDNSPIWDNAFNRIIINEYKYSKMRIDNKKVNEKERPTDLTYERYIKLIQLFKLYKFNERLIFENSEFIVQDVLFNTLLLQSNKALIELAKILDYKNDINLLSYWVNKTEIAIETKLYSNGFFYDYDLKIKKLIDIKTITGLSPIVFTKYSRNIITNLKKHFLKTDNYNIASLDRSHIDFDSINYWRGPMWINLSWLILSEIKNLDKDLFNNIKDNCLDKINDIGFFEYFDSNDTDNLIESGIGDNSFSWTAAIFVCMLNDIEF